MIRGSLIRPLNIIVLYKVREWAIICFVLFLSLDWNKESITEPRPTMTISVDDLHDIGTGLQKLEDFIPKIVCHSVKNEFAVGKKWSILQRILPDYSLNNCFTSTIIEWFFF